MREVTGTIMFEPWPDMTYQELRGIIEVISYETGEEGGHESSFTLSGDIMFFHITEDEADGIRSGLENLLGDRFDELNVCYDTEFEEDD